MLLLYTKGVGRRRRWDRSCGRGRWGFLLRQRWGSIVLARYMRQGGVEERLIECTHSSHRRSRTPVFTGTHFRLRIALASIGHLTTTTRPTRAPTIFPVGSKEHTVHTGRVEFMWGDDLALRAVHGLAALATPYANEVGGARHVFVVVMRRRRGPARRLWAGRQGAHRGRLIRGIKIAVVVLHVRGDRWYRGGGGGGPSRWERRTRTAAAVAAVAAASAAGVHDRRRSSNTSSSGSSVPAGLDALQTRVEHGSGDTAIGRVVELKLDRASVSGEWGHISGAPRVARGRLFVRCARAGPTRTTPPISNPRKRKRALFLRHVRHVHFPLW